MLKKQAPLDFIKKYYQDDLNERSSPESQWYLKKLNYVNGKSVLNVGCGPCFYEDIQFFNVYPEKYYGTDINTNCIKFLKDKEINVYKSKICIESSSTLEVNLLVDNILIFNEDLVAKFDTVLCVGVLGKFNRIDIEKAIHNIFLYLKKGGRIINIDWTECKLSEKMIQERINIDWYDTEGLNRQKIVEIFNSYGFQLIKNEKYSVNNPKEYGWGEIYFHLLEKTI